MAATRSTKTRLTAYFTASFGSIVVFVALASYVVVNRNGYSDLDASLSVAANTTAMSAQHELSEHSVKRDGEDDLQIILDEPQTGASIDSQIMIREGSRTVAYKPGVLGTADLRKTSPLLLRDKVSADGLRVACRELTFPRFHATYQIYSASSLRPLLDKLRMFRILLLVFIPLGLAAAAGAGYLLAQRALEPLNELTRTIEAVTSSHLSARVHLAQPQGDLGRLARRFNSLLDRLERAFNTQRQFMADASHQIRTPLTVALTTTQVTARDDQRTVKDCDKAMAIVETQLLRLRSIVDNMLFLSQADATSLQIDHREFYLDDAISEAVRAAAVLAKAKRQSLKIEHLLEAPCLGDEELLRQAVLILLDNAVKYSLEAGQISVALNDSKGFWSCRIVNNGPPIPAEQQNRIFQRFFRGQGDETGKTPGAGLGLAIARSIAESHGGSLDLVSSDEQRTIFELLIPIRKFQSAAEQARNGGGSQVPVLRL